jgi:hypothetical protein
MAEAKMQMNESPLRQFNVKFYTIGHPPHSTEEFVSPLIDNTPGVC